MTTTFKIELPDAVECTMAITMPLRDWKALRDELPPSQHPSWKLREAIGALVSKAQKEFQAEGKTE